MHVDYDVIPNVVYTAPELASVGMTEEQAKERGLEVRIGTFPFQANARARCLGETEGGVKVIADAKTDRILGVHILGAAGVRPHRRGGARDGVRCEQRRTSRAPSTRIPTLPEAIKEAALGVAKRSHQHLSRARDPAWPGRARGTSS